MRFAVALVALALGLPAAGAEQQGGTASQGAQKPSQAAPSPAPGEAAEPGQPAPRLEKPERPPSKAAHDLARALLPKEEWDRILDRYSSSLSGQLSQNLSMKGEAVPDDLGGTVRKQLAEKLPYEETMRQQARALGEHFTEGELTQATRFYSSKLGTKVLRELPGAQEDVGKFLQMRLAVVVPEIVKQVAPKALEPAQGAPGAEPGEKGAPPQARKPPPGQAPNRP